jgi:type I site-specific restriction endonuclease
MKPVLNLPTVQHQIRIHDGIEEIWDDFRKKYVVLTPEEWVRQNFLHYLSNVLKYPKALLKVEGGLRYNQKQKRPDIVAYDRKGKPFLVVECKATDIVITQKVFEQASVYNTRLLAKYLVVTNGRQHFCCLQDHDSKKTHFLNAIPEFES